MSNLRTDGNNNTYNTGTIQITNTQFITFYKQLTASEQTSQSLEMVDKLKRLPHLTFLFMASMPKYILSKTINMDNYMAGN